MFSLKVPLGNCRLNVMAGFKQIFSTILDFIFLTQFTAYEHIMQFF